MKFHPDPTHSYKMSVKITPICVVLPWQESWHSSIALSVKIYFSTCATEGDRMRSKISKAQLLKVQSITFFRARHQVCGFISSWVMAFTKKNNNSDRQTDTRLYPKSIGPIGCGLKIIQSGTTPNWNMDVVHLRYVYCAVIGCQALWSSAHT